MIKRIGTEARQDLERFFGTKVFLDLRVKVNPDWRNNERTLDELGVPKRTAKPKREPKRKALISGRRQKLWNFSAPPTEYPVSTSNPSRAANAFRRPSGRRVDAPRGGRGCRGLRAAVPSLSGPGLPLRAPHDGVAGGRRGCDAGRVSRGHERRRALRRGQGLGRRVAVRDRPQPRAAASRAGPAAAAAR